MLCFLTLVFLQSAPGQQSGNVRTLRDAVERTVSLPALSRSITAIEISDLTSGRILVSKNADLFLRPASNAKIFSSAAALLSLPDSFRFETRMYVRTGNNGLKELWIKAGNDPLFDAEDIQKMADEIAEQNIENLDVIHFDLNRFDSTRRYGAGWMIDDENDPSMPCMSSFPVQRNTVVLDITASGTPGKACRVFTEPDASLLDIHNAAVSGNANSISIERTPFTNHYKISGSLRTGEHLRKEYSLWQPELITTKMFHAAFLRNGVCNSTSRCAFGAVPFDARCVASCSHLLDEVLIVMNKESDNLCAETVLRSLAAGEAPFPVESGLAKMKQALRSIAVDTSSVQLVDGSGLSFYNLVTAASIGQTLRGMYGSKERDRFIRTLAVGGKDGTMKHRFKEMMNAHFIRAKSGTLRGVHCLSGYILPMKGAKLSFVILLENISGKFPYRQVQDSILKHCMDYSASEDVKGTR
jgi:serine-type D-Ala-D-Ala carboxypeptidase/endopeptidase (penicillin-binding protein 4)